MAKNEWFGHIFNIEQQKKQGRLLLDRDLIFTTMEIYFVFTDQSFQQVYTQEMDSRCVEEYTDDAPLDKLVSDLQAGLFERVAYHSVRNLKIFYYDSLRGNDVVSHLSINAVAKETYQPSNMLEKVEQILFWDAYTTEGKPLIRTLQKEAEQKAREKALLELERQCEIAHIDVHITTQHNVVYCGESAVCMYLYTKEDMNKENEMEATPSYYVPTCVPEKAAASYYKHVAHKMLFDHFFDPLFEIGGVADLTVMPFDDTKDEKTLSNLYWSNGCEINVYYGDQEDIELCLPIGMYTAKGDHVKKLRSFWELPTSGYSDASCYHNAIYHFLDELFAIIGSHSADLLQEKYDAILKK